MLSTSLLTEDQLLATFALYSELRSQPKVVETPARSNILPFRILRGGKADAKTAQKEEIAA